MKPEALVDAFEKAVEEFAFIGTIPGYSEDMEEQRAMDAERATLRRNRTRARNQLLKALESAQLAGR